jgi:hypothetical protein
MRVSRIGFFFLLVLIAFASTDEHVKSVMTFNQIVQSLTKGSSAEKLEAMVAVSYAVRPPGSLWIGRLPSKRMANLSTNERSQLVAILDTVAGSEKGMDNKSAALVTMCHLREGTDAELRIQRHMETNSAKVKLAVIRFYAARADSVKEFRPLDIVPFSHCVVRGAFGWCSPLR